MYYFVHVKTSSLHKNINYNYSNIPRNPLQYDPADLFTWCSSQLRNSNPLVVDIAVQYLQSLCSIHEYKQGFYESKSGIAM